MSLRAGILVLSALVATLSYAQTAPTRSATLSTANDALPSPSFDVATIKPSPASGPGPANWVGIRNDADGIDAQFTTLSMLIQLAYGLRSTDQVSGGPEWTRDEHYDVRAKMSSVDIAALAKLSPIEAVQRREQMLQALLEERFKLKVHPEIRQAPAFALVVAKGGPKLRDTATDPNPPLGKGKDGKPLVGFNQATGHTMVAQGISTKALADFLSRPTSGLGRPVIDQTGLTAVYDFTLNWVPNWNAILPGTARSAPSPEEADSLFEALQQIGLKLQPATAPVSIVVIDHVEPPSEN
jgi:uncharacterized protein (TIGR03435 family)